MTRSKVKVEVTSP